MACSWQNGTALTSHFVNNDYVAAETIYSTCACVTEVNVTAEIIRSTAYAHHLV